jgi:hypothetical protein
MCIRKWLVLGLVAVSAGLLGCKEEQVATQPVGGIELVVRSTNDARMLGAFTVRRNTDSKTWRLPVRAEGYQKQRLSVEPGLYALDFEPDVSAAVANPSLEASVHVATGELPRWVVVAPARVTTVNVGPDVESSAPCIAATPLARARVN